MAATLAVAGLNGRVAVQAEASEEGKELSRLVVDVVEAGKAGHAGRKKERERKDRTQIGARPIPHCGLRSTGALLAAAAPAQRGVPACLSGIITCKNRRLIFQN